MSIYGDSTLRILILATVTFAPPICDFSKARLEGARISGALFPAELSSAEITLSVDHGMRMRY